MTTQRLDLNRGPSACGLCGSTDLVLKFIATDRNFETTLDHFRICRCAKCGVVQTIPRPSVEESKSFYPEMYYPTTQASEEYYNKHIRDFQQDKLSLVQSRVSNGSLLDIGCGSGFFLWEALKAGFAVTGVEFSDEAAAYGREHFGLAITTGNIYDLSLERQGYDVVTLWQVLEHLDSPRELLHMVYESLKPSGLLIISVPNISSFQALIFRHRWYHLEVPRHIYHYDPETLGQVLAEAGFRVVDIDFNSAEHNGSGFLGSIIRFNLKEENLLHKMFRKTIGRYFCQCLGWAESKMGRGGVFTIFATRT
jgi:SAM-dependent methyltransferase